VALPSDLEESIRSALEEHGLGRRIERVVEVAGGCINHGARVDTDSGASLFIKWNTAAPPGLFDAEADGLVAMAEPDVVRVPAPVAWHDAPDGDRTSASWLLMEHIPAQRPSARTEELLGIGLAKLHAAGPVVASGGAFGWRRDNWIGSLAQVNTPTRGWARFWCDHRLAPQLRRARASGHLVDRVLDLALEHAAEALAGVVGSPDLLHGDLWAGNWFTGPGGEPVLIDPAVYLGHGEVDLAMSELFGGFGARFYDAYRDARGISRGYGEYRRDLYQLYYLMAHVNLFGAAYVAGSLRAARHVVAALRR